MLIQSACRGGGDLLPEFVDAVFSTRGLDTQKLYGAKVILGTYLQLYFCCSCYNSKNLIFHACR